MSESSTPTETDQTEQSDGTELTEDTAADTDSTIVADPNDDDLDDDSDDTEDDEVGSSGREAARYRRRLREVEVERDGLLERVEVLHRAEVDRITEALNIKPAGLWASGVVLADLRDEDGDVDAHLVTAAVKRAGDELGLRPRVGFHIDHSGHGGVSARSWKQDAAAVVSGDRGRRR